MADQTILFDELLQLTNLRARTYRVLEIPGAGKACIDASARRGPDWFFARRWVSIEAGRRLLYWVLDDAETRGFRFRVAATKPDPAPRDPNRGRPWVKASEAWTLLTEEERRIHSELFPSDEAFLRRGYDWDEAGVYRNGERMPADEAGRVLETENGVVHEWVRVEEEWTWRRYPLYVNAILSRPQPAAAVAAG